MAINDRFQLTNYGSEVQQAIDNALIHLPQELALKAYRDEVLTKTQTTPYEPTLPYHPATKLYVDTTNSTTNQRLDEEIERAKKAEDTLNNKQVLTYDEDLSSYRYMKLVDLDVSTQSLVDEDALDAKLAELAVGFFIYMQVKEDTGELIEGRYEEGVNPYIVVDSKEQLPLENVPDDSIGLTLNDDTTINVYKYTNNEWQLLNTPTMENGWLFASTSDDKGYYWFVNTWNLIDMNVDMTQYYTKNEIDNLLKDYASNSTIGDLDSLETTTKVNIVSAINEVRTLANNKDALPVIDALSVLANTSASTSKPTIGLSYRNTVENDSLAQRTSTGTLKASDAVADDDLTTLSQVKSLINNVDIDKYQSKIQAGTPYDIVAYSDTDGVLNTLKRVTTINTAFNSTSDMNIPTEKAIATYVQNYKPIIITQGNENTSVATTQLTFWIEQ